MYFFLCSVFIYFTCLLLVLLCELFLTCAPFYFFFFFLISLHFVLRFCEFPCIFCLSDRYVNNLSKTHCVVVIWFLIVVCIILRCFGVRLVLLLLIHFVSINFVVSNFRLLPSILCCVSCFFVLVSRSNSSNSLSNKHIFNRCISCLILYIILQTLCGIFSFSYTVAATSPAIDQELCLICCFGFRFVFRHALPCCGTTLLFLSAR